MNIRAATMVTGFAALAAGSAGATQYTANPGNFAAVFMAAQSGDSIRLTGNFGAVNLAGKTFAVPLQIDASGATFSDSLVLKNVQGVAFTGGYFGSTTHDTRLGSPVRVYGGGNISFNKARVVGASDGTGQGIAFVGASNVAITNSSFTGLKSGVGIVGTSYATLTHNRSIASVSDGFDVADSHFVSVAGTTCSGGAPAANAHPDCVQLFSISGHASQSDISITGNSAYGPTQGFTSFDHNQGGGLRIDISHNLVQTSYPQGIACYNCVDSTFTYNTLNTLAGSAHRTNLNIVGGSNNTIFGNTFGRTTSPPDPAPPTQTDVPTEIVQELDDLLNGLLNGLGLSPIAPPMLTSSSYGDRVTPSGVGAVPEPDAWLMLIAGFGFIGTAMRRRTARAAVA